MEQKRWEDLELKDDFMFAKVMRDKQLCIKMLERLLDIKIADIKYPEDQKVIDIQYDSKSVRLDVYVEDDENTIYDVEIQTSNTGELPKRSRYYQGMIDLNMIEKGELYSKLNKSFVIFICTFDPFGKGLYRYTFENICKEDKTLSLNDQAVKLFFNTTGVKGAISDETKAFLQYIGGTASSDAYVKELEERIAKVKLSEEWKVEYMTLLMRDKENIEKGRQEGRVEGRREGKINGKIVARFEDGLRPEEIAKKMGISVEQVNAVLEEEGLLQLV